MKREIDGEILYAARYWQVRPQGPLEFPEWLQQSRELFPDAHDLPETEIDAPMVLHAQLLRERFFWHWADSGFTTFSASHSYAAALMATDTSTQSGDLIVPWRCVRVRVPPGILETDHVKVHAIYVQSIDGYHASLAYSDRPWDVLHESHLDDLEEDDAKFRMRVADTLADVLWYTADETDFLTVAENGVEVEDPHEHEKRRLMRLCCNYVAGLFYTLQHTRDWTQREHKNHYGWHAAGERRPPPTHRNVVLGRPIAVNLSAPVRELARGTSRASLPAMFQALVRGHYKRQVIGVGRSGRKVIWVEPYWRGPEAAPVIVRPYHFR